MAASIPSQVRTVDPFASYNSNTVNEHTKMVTYDEEGLAKINDLRVTDALDATSTAVFVSTGIAYKDEVLIDITAQGTVDFNTADHYYGWDFPGLGFDENGYYYIIMNYVYVKSRPAPQASYQILKPSQRGSFSTGGSWLFLAAVLISGVGGSGAQIDSIHDFDPENPDNRRLYVKSYIGTETLLPDHNQTRDQSRVAYDALVDEFYFGYSDSWRSLGKGSGSIVKDTSGVGVGDLVYINGAGNVTQAVLSAEAPSADGVVVISDSETGSPPGTIQLIGLVENVPVESGATPIVGELLYLSGSEAGAITNVKTTPIVQFVGRCIATDSTTVDMLFVRGPVTETNTAISVREQLSVWAAVGDGIHEYAEVDISEIGLQYNVVTVVDAADDMQISPSNIYFASTIATEIWMPLGTGATLNVTVVG